ncbi:unnamed protein product [Nesidiocoris tenuis]|uniref:CPC1/SPEF2 domain-containing protein n=1 Tax=Nesidiocoris tenuis TaxID=355587 RepID=A0A6H5G698_9HEMI|nr:unnamed protein product [Nesidiocoris tenuis]
MDNEFSSSLKTSMNHQSHYEKYQAAKWSKAHHTLARFFETGLYKYTDSDEEIDKGHVVKNKTLREGGEAIAKQQEPTWILHKKLYAKRMKHRKRCNFEMCRHIVQDLVDVLMKVLLYRYEHKREPVPRKVMNDWKECFWKCQLTVHPDPLVYDDSSVDEEEFVPEEVIDYLEDEEEYSEIILDQEITRILHEYDLHCYLYEVGPWDLAKWPDWDNNDENLMISGFIVHRLLQTKYPLPRRYQDPKLDFKVRAAVNPLQDQNSAYIYNSMRNLLAAQKVLVIDIAEPVSFCLAKYNEEISAIGEIENAVQAKEQAKETKPTADRPSSLKKQRASKAGSKGGKKSISMKGKGSKDAGAGEPGNKKATGGGRKSKMPGGARKSAAGGARKSAAGGGRKSAAGGARKSAAGGARKSAAGGARKSAAGGAKKPAAGAGSKPAAEARKSVAGGEKKKSGKRKSKERSRSPGPRSKSGKRIFEKSAQCPSVDELLPRVNHSPAGILGKEAFTALNEGRPVGDLLAEIFRLNNIESIEGGANEVFEIDAGSIEDLRRAVEAVRPGDVPISGSTGDLEEETQNYPGGEQVKIIEYPYWDLKPHKQLLTAADVKQREKIRNQAYNTGRFRPYLLEEDYLKMKTHVLCLISYLRSRKKHQPNPCNVLVQASLSNFDKVLHGEENEEKSEEGGEERAVFGLTATLQKVEEHKRPVTYTQILKLRSSEILPRPNKDEMEIHYRTSAFMQKYIKWLTQDQAKSENDNYQARKEKYDKIINGELPQEENFALDPIIEESPDSFYKIFGTKLNCDYNRLDYDSITRICRMIIGEPWEDADLERKRSAELFDIEALQKLMKDLPGKKKASGSSKRKSKAPRKSKAARKSAAGGARKSKTGSARKSTAAGASKRQSKSPSKGKPGEGVNSKSAATSGKESAIGLDQEKAEESPEHPLKAQTIVMPQPDLPLPPRPGELGWEYVQEPVPDILQIYLATTWESIEFEYLANLKTAFRAMRTHDNTVIPYRNFIREEMERHLEMSDDRMKTVDLFQENFNKVEQKVRNRADVKQSLHCRTFALYNDLVDIADDKRSKALARREDLLNQQWVPKHLFTLANLYRNLIQAEINRTVQTLQLLHDYYYAMLQKPPCETRLQRLSIPKVFYPEISDSLGSFLVNNLETSSKPQLHDDDQMNADALVSNINHILSSCAAKLDIDSTNPMIDESITLAKGMINDLFDYYESLILDPGLGKELRPKVLKKQTPEEEKARRKQEKEFRKMLERRKQVDIADRTPSENRDSKPPKIKRKKDVEHTVEKEDSAIINKRRRFQIDASQLQMVDKLKWEWLVAVQNEIARFHSRLDLIEKRGKADFEEVLSIMKAVFDEFLLDVGWHYRREMSAIEEAVNIFKAATDTAVNIPVQMNLGSIRFYLGKRENADLFPEVPPPPNSPSHQVPPEFWPTMHQLSNFMRKIEDASPNGIIRKISTLQMAALKLFGVDHETVILCKNWYLLRVLRSKFARAGVERPRPSEPDEPNRQSVLKGQCRDTADREPRGERRRRFSK